MVAAARWAATHGAYTLTNRREALLRFVVEDEMCGGTVMLTRSPESSSAYALLFCIREGACTELPLLTRRFLKGLSAMLLLGSLNFSNCSTVGHRMVITSPAFVQGGSSTIQESMH